MAIYIDTGDEQEPLMPEITEAPKEVAALAAYVERYFKMLREDLLRLTEGSWRFIDDDGHIEAEKWDTTTEAWVRKFRIRGS